MSLRVQSVRSESVWREKTCRSVSRALVKALVPDGYGVAWF